LIHFRQKVDVGSVSRNAEPIQISLFGDRVSGRNDTLILAGVVEDKLALLASVAIFKSSAKDLSIPIFEITIKG
jgi:hypothetical protein